MPISNEFTSVLSKDWEINFIDNHSEYFDIEVKEKSHGKKIKITNLKFNHKTMKYE